jgi:single-stranded-DNA-specific exonuclease
MPAARRDERLRGFLRDAVGIVALATVADVVPLVGENRVLVHAGLQALTGSTHPGIRALREVAGIDGATVTGDDVVWRLSPRLNAAGRLNRPELAIELLTTDDLARARELARAIDAANEERRAIEKVVTAEAHEIARERMTIGETGGRRSLVVAGEGWHRGVIGIVAARLVDAHRVPVVVIGLDADGGRGSCRTPRDVDLHRALTRCAVHLRRFGGHAAAAGLEIERGAIAAFAEAFEEAVRDQAGPDDDAGASLVDGEATPDDFSLETVEAMRRLAPFGAGNPEPRFVLRGCVVAGRPRLLGAASEHLSFTVRCATGALRVVAFRQAKRFDLAASGGRVDLLASPSVNSWRGVRTPELVVHQIAPSA